MPQSRQSSSGLEDSGGRGKNAKLLLSQHLLSYCHGFSELGFQSDTYGSSQTPIQQYFSSLGLTNRLSLFREVDLSILQPSLNYMSSTVLKSLLDL